MNYHCEYALQDSDGNSPVPVLRKGMTSIEAANFLRQEFPSRQDWFFWNPERNAYARYLRELVERPGQREGALGVWSWKRLTCSYPDIFYWANDPKDRHHYRTWSGAIEVCGPGGDDFILFSYLNSKGTIGEVFFVSAADPMAPHRFGQELEKQKQPKQDERIVIHTSSGPDVTVGLDDEPIYLAGAIQDDIEGQCLAFFNDRPMYCRLNVPYKRGFLFVGSPGTGKTMMIRNVIRKVCSRHKHIKVSALTGGDTTDNALGFFMAQGEREAPMIMILEELDSLAKHSRVTRAGLLTQLDGLEPHEGLMVLATTNNPGEVDPALMHRPSRFDRVWRFDLPDAGLRRRYMEDKFGGCSEKVLDTLARKSEGWIFAYLNELRVTAGVIAIREHGGQAGDVAMLKAHRLLVTQYEAGRKNHVMAENGPALGFKSE